MEKDSIDNNDNGDLLLATEADDEPDFGSTLMNINNTMLAMSESLKRLHNQQDAFVSAESAKKAKLATDPQSDSDTNATNDVRMLLESSTAESETAKDCHDEADLLLTEIEQTLNQEERTDDPVSKKTCRYCKPTLATTAK